MNTEALLDALLDKGALSLVFDGASIEKVKDGQREPIDLTVEEYVTAKLEGKERELLREKCLKHLRPDQIRSVAEEYCRDDPHIMSLLIGKTSQKS